MRSVLKDEVIQTLRIEPVPYPVQKGATFLLSSGSALGSKMEGVEGFEPSNVGIKTRCLWPLGDTPINGL